MRQYLTRREVAREYPISYSALAHLAMEGRGPPYSLIGRKAVYDALKVERWIESHGVDLAAKLVRANLTARRGRPRKVIDG